MSSLKVKLPPEYTGEQVQTFSIKGDTVREAIVQIANETSLTSPELYAFFIPNESGGGGKWFSPQSSLESLNAKNATVHMRRSHWLIPTVFHHTEFRSKMVLFSMFEPLSEWAKYVGFKFSVDVSDNCFQFALIEDNKQSTALQLNKSLSEQTVTEPKDMRILFYHKDFPADKTGLIIFLEIQAKQLNRGTKNKADESTDAPLMDLSLDCEVDLESPANNLLVNFPILNGSMSQMNKKKKLERYFCILIANHLFYYRSQNDPKPTQVLPLANFEVNVVEDKKKKLQLIELTSLDKKQQISNKADDPRWHKLWYDALVKCIAEAKEQVERKKEELKNKASGDSSTKVFEAPLAAQVEVADGSQLPPVVEKCIEYIEERALDVEGIFRLSGSANLIKEYKDRFDAGEDVSFENESDPHAVSGLLKLYFRELPEPIMTWEQFDNFIIGEGIQNPGLRLRYLRHLIDNLPALNRALLRRLVSFLRKVNDHSAVNKMPIHNIATVFGPNLLKQKNANMLQMVEDTAQINNIVNILINYDGYLLNDRPAPDETEEESLMGLFAKAIYDYEGDSPEDLNFKKNNIVAVIARGVDGWWRGELDGKFGKFPGSYVQPISKEVYQKNMRRVRFEKEMKRIKQTLIDEQKTIEKLEEELVVLEKQAAEIDEQYNAISEVVQDSVSVFKSSKIYHEFFMKNKELLEQFTTFSTCHDDIADSRFAILEGLKAFSAAVAPAPKDKKKKVDKKQEKLHESIRTSLEGIYLRFEQELALHKSILQLDSNVVQGLQHMDLLSLFVENKQF